MKNSERPPNTDAMASSAVLLDNSAIPKSDKITNCVELKVPPNDTFFELGYVVLPKSVFYLIVKTSAESNRDEKLSVDSEES